MRVATFFLPAAALALSACTYEAPVSATTSAANSIVPARVSSGSVGYFFAPGLQSLSGEASGGPCAYPVTVGPALVESLESVTKAAFPLGAQRLESDSSADAQRHLSFTLDTFSPDVSLDTRWFSVGAEATVDLAVRVVVTSATGEPVWNGLIEGRGFAEGESAGGCAKGGEMLTAAGNEAVRRLTEDYVAKIINSGVI